MTIAMISMLTRQPADSVRVYPATSLLNIMMHTVRGSTVHGLIVDLGAAAGLMGIDTLRLFMRGSLDPLGLKDVFHSSDRTFTGIDGSPVPSLRKCVLPIGVPGLENAKFVTDLIGSSGAHCPGLLLLETLIQFRATLICQAFDDAT